MNFFLILRFLYPGKDLGSFSEEIPEDQELLPTLDEVAQRSSEVFIPEIPGKTQNFGIFPFPRKKEGGLASKIGILGSQKCGIWT